MYTSSLSMTCSCFSFSFSVSSYIYQSVCFCTHRMHGNVTFVAQNLEGGLVRLISTPICCISLFVLQSNILLIKALSYQVSVVLLIDLRDHDSCKKKNYFY